jgi:O-antigen/teichoic acid export membrane protein
VFIAWTLPVIAAVIAVNIYIYSRLLPGHMRMLDAASALPSSRALLTFVSGEYVASLATITLQACPALIVVSTLGPAAAAYLAVPWMFASTFYALIGSISTPLLVESVADPGARSVHARRSAMIGMAIVIPLCVVVALGAPLLLHLLGRQYAAQGTPVLRFVAAAVPFAGVNVLYLTLARVVRRVRRSVMTQVGSSVLVNGLTLLLVKGHGVAGVGFAFLTGQAIIAIVVGPSLIRQYRSLGRPGGGVGNDSAVLGL